MSQLIFPSHQYASDIEGDVGIPQSSGVSVDATGIAGDSPTAAPCMDNNTLPSAPIAKINKHRFFGNISSVAANELLEGRSRRKT